MGIITQAFSNSQSAWYHDHKLYKLHDGQTHGMWLTEHGKEFGMNIIPIDEGDEWGYEWRTDMEEAFSHGFLRIQKFNDIATITVPKFNDRSVNLIFSLAHEFPSYLSDCRFIEVMSFDWETYYSELDDSEKYEDGNYICAESVNELLKSL